MMWLAVAVAIVVMLVVLSRRRDVVEEPWRDEPDMEAMFGRRPRRTRRSGPAGTPSSMPGPDGNGHVPFMPDPEFTAIGRGEYLPPAAEARWLHTDPVSGLPNVGLRRERGQVVLFLRDEGVPAGPGLSLLSVESPRLADFGLFIFRPRGVTLHEQAIQAADLWAPAPVVMRREFHDPEFPDAIDLYTPGASQGAGGPESGALLGTVDRATAARLAPLMDAGQDLAAITLSGPRAGTFGTPIVVLAARADVLDALLLAMS